MATTFRRPAACSLCRDSQPGRPRDDRPGEATAYQARQTAARPRVCAALISLTAGARKPSARRVRSGETTGCWSISSAPWLDAEDRVRVELRGPGGDRSDQGTARGRPRPVSSVSTPPGRPGPLNLARTGKERDARLDLHITWDHLNLPAADRAAIEAEPNDRGNKRTSCGSAATFTAPATTSTTSKTARREDRARLVPVRGEGRKAGPGLLPARPA